MDTYRVSTFFAPKKLLLNPFCGSAYLAAFIALALRFGGWPTAAGDASLLLAIFELLSVLIVISVVTENDDWKADMRHGSKPFERLMLTKLMLFHTMFGLATTIVGVTALHVTAYVDLVLACAIFVSGVTSMSFMLLGRK